MNAQAAFEYMVIAMLVLGFLTPVWIYLLTIQNQSRTELSLSYAKFAVERTADVADFVYSQGPPANMKVKIYIPPGIEYYNITNHTIRLKVRVQEGVTDVFAVSKAVLNGTFPINEGTYWINIKAFDDYVNISY